MSRTFPRSGVMILMLFGLVFTSGTSGVLADEQKQKGAGDSDVQERAVPVNPRPFSERRIVTSPPVCQRLGLEFDGKNNLCLKSEGARPPQQSASGGPQQKCHNACVQAASNVGGTVWYSGLDEMGACLCAICDIPIPGLTRLFGKTFCNVFSLGK